MNKYYQTLDKILQTGKIQTNRKGRIKYLLNERLMLTPADLLDIFESHGIARKKLKEELKLFMQGVLCSSKLMRENWCYLHISVVLMRTLGFRLIFIIFI